MLDNESEYIYDGNQLSLFAIYNSEVKENDLLTKEEEIELFTKLRSNDPNSKEIKDKIIKSNLRLVINIAKKYLTSGEPFLDLIQEGNIGLIQSIDNFDITKGYKFSTYATGYIKRNIIIYLKENTKAIRIPRYNLALIQKLNKLEYLFYQKTGKKISEAEIAHELGITIERIKELKKYRKNMNMKSLDEQIPLNNSVSITLGNLISDPNTLCENEQSENKIIVEKLLNTLSDEYREIIEYRYGLNGKKEMTQREFGKMKNYSGSNVMQKETIIKKKLLKVAMDMGLDKEIKGFGIINKKRK